MDLPHVTFELAEGLTEGRCCLKMLLTGCEERNVIIYNCQMCGSPVWVLQNLDPCCVGSCSRSVVSTTSMLLARQVDMPGIIDPTL